MTENKKEAGPSRPRFLGLDYETYSETDIASCGAFKYISDPHFEVLLLGYAFEDEPVRCVDFTAGETLPDTVRAALLDPAITKTAYNCAFEREVTRAACGLYCPPEQWLDTLVIAASCGLPLGLGAVGEAMGLTPDKAKMKEGKDLISYFCKPCKPSVANGGRTRVRPMDAPDKWETFKAYNLRDVETERTIREELMAWVPDETEHRFWCLDARINENGIKFDRPLAVAAEAMDSRYKAELTERAMALTGMENPKSAQQIKAWLREQEGLEVPSLNKKALPDVVAELTTEKARAFMALRRELSRSSTAKFEAMLRSGGSDDHVRGCFQFFGGHTGRFAGRLVQLQNLSKNDMGDIAVARALVRDGDYETVKALYGSVSSTLSELIRPTLIPETGCRFIDADFSAIEARVIAWLAGEEWRLNTFRAGEDIYCASASQMFKVPVEKHGVNGDLRPKGKIAELALGYGGGVNALRAFGADRLGMSEDDMADTVHRWRGASPRIPALWRALESAAARCIVQRTHTVSNLGGIRFDLEQGILFMTLPSGRRMAYWGAAYGQSAERLRSGRVISYMGIDPRTKKWSRIETFGGRLTENLVQATARDILRDKMLALESAGYDIRAHIHDEVLISEPENDRRVLNDVVAILSAPLPWAPGLPLDADGWEGPYYRKD